MRDSPQRYWVHNKMGILFQPKEDKEEKGAESTCKDDAVLEEERLNQRQGTPLCIPSPAYLARHKLIITKGFYWTGSFIQKNKGRPLPSPSRSPDQSHFFLPPHLRKGGRKGEGSHAADSQDNQRVPLLYHPTPTIHPRLSCLHIHSARAPLPHLFMRFMPFK